MGVRQVSHKQVWIVGQKGIDGLTLLVLGLLQSVGLFFAHQVG